MFYLTYLHHELRRRAGRTLLTVLGLAVGVALVVVTSAMSDGLDRAQRKVLGPLAGVGTDLVVTRPVQATGQGTGAQRGGVPGFGLGGGGAVSPADQQALVQENSSLLTDLSKLGKPGDKFSRDFFLPATQLTFAVEEASKVAKLDGVTAVSPGLTLLATHQEGTVPEIVAEFQTGGETIEQTVRAEPMTPQEQQAFQECVQSRGGFQPRQPGAPQGPPPAFEGCLPERFRQQIARFTTPLRTLRQFIAPPSTDIASQPYTIAGVDTSTPELALITPGQVSDGRWFGAATGEAVLAEAYARRKDLKTGSELKLNDTTFKVVGLARPPLGGQAADVYLSLPDLQKLSAREGRVNVLQVRADDAGQVGALSKRVEESFDGAQVTSAEDLAQRVSGSLVEAGHLAKGLGIALAAVGLVAAFLIACLLSLSSVSKRARELGTLKALGWRQGLVVRQVVGESLAQGVLGALLGAALGLAGAALFGIFGPELHANAIQQGPAGPFGLGRIAQAAATEASVRLSAPVDPLDASIAAALAIVGGLLAGGAGALRVARLRPADSLRTL